MRRMFFPLAMIASVAMACSRDQSAPDALPTVPSSAPLRASTTTGATVAPNECATPGAGWIFCDDFESDRLAKYFEYDKASGAFVRATGTGVGGSVGMRATYKKGTANAGSLKVAFGRTPSSSFRPADAGTANYREIYWRVFVRRETGWVGNGPDKLTRAIVFAKSDWSEAMIAHGWTDSNDSRYLALDPASGTDASGNVTTVGYNDFNHLRWLGATRTAAAEEDQAHVGVWACYEFHVKMNDAGQSNGVFELTVNGQPSAKKTGLNWVGAYNAYGLNSVFLENYQNAGAPAANVRTLDNFVVSTQPIGCGSGAATTPPPAPVAVAVVSVTPATSSATVGKAVQLSAVTKDANGNVLTGRSISWTSGNTSVATVSATGLVTLGAVGSATISATSEGIAGTATVTAAPIPVALVTVTPGTATGLVGQTAQLAAAVTDANGNALTGRTITWSSSSSAIASVSTTGNVTFVGAGAATVTATSEGKTGSSNITVTASVALPPTGSPTANECATPGAGWIFCDDFESDRLAKYFEYDNASGTFVRATGTGVGGSVGMRATYTKGSANAGSLKVAFGRTPSSAFRAVDAGTANYREIYWRVFVRRETGWVGNGPDKLTRAIVFAKSDWSEAMIAHGWTDSNDSRYLALDPASGTDASGNVTTVGYNDFTHLRWLGATRTAAAEEDQAHVGVWACYEFHVKMNDAGQSNGVFELTVNGQPSAKKTGLNWVGAYNAYGLNSVFLEHYQNAGAPAANVRTLDNFVVSTQPIGCGK